MIVHRFAGDKLAVESFTGLACFGPSLISVKERERVSDKVQLKVSNQRFMNSCLGNSLSVNILHCSTHLLTSSALNECLLVHNFHN